MNHATVSEHPDCENDNPSKLSSKRSHLGSSHFGSSIPSQEQPDQECARNLDTALHILTQASLQPRPFITLPLGQLERQSAKGEWLRDEAEAVVSLVKHTVQAARAGDIGVQGIANAAYGAACSGKGKLSSLFIFCFFCVCVSPGMRATCYFGSVRTSSSPCFCWPNNRIYT